MAQLPVPASVFFNDFSSDVLKYNVLDNDTLVGTYDGLSNSDEYGNYIGFLMSDNPKISIGSTICTVDGLESFKVSKILYDRYNGEAELFKAYY